ncbi:MAG: ATP-binding protein [Spirochaetes bacterium]|nr:ATP-binding protein [Spirochaetota bacterium]
MKIKDSENFIKENLVELYKIVEQYVYFLEKNHEFIVYLKKRYNIQDKFILDVEENAKRIYQFIPALRQESEEDFFKSLRDFLYNDYSVFLALLKMLFYQVMFYDNKENVMDLISSSDDPAFDSLVGNYFLLTMNFKKIRNVINQFHFKDIELKDELVVDNNTELWLVTDMEHDIFPSDIHRVQEYTDVIISVAKEHISEEDYKLLQHEVSELIINAIKHGNKNDAARIIRVWYKFQDDLFKFIIEDQGEGFKDLEKWNEFNRKRNQAIRNKNFEMLEQYAFYKSNDFEEEEAKGGSTLFGALEYWDSGLIFNSKRNKIVAVKYFYRKSS